MRPALEECDALVFDRWVDTHHCAGPRRYGHDPFTRELSAGFPPLDGLFLLEASAETALARRVDRAELTVDEDPRMLAAYARGLGDLARRRGALVLDAREPFETNAGRIRAAADACIAARPVHAGGAP